MTYQWRVFMPSMGAMVVLFAYALTRLRASLAAIAPPSPWRRSLW